MAHRRYTDRQVENAVATAVLIGNVDKAVKRLRIPEGTLRSWLRARGYKTLFGNIYHPDDLNDDE
jgi:hypothetical protein